MGRSRRPRLGGWLWLLTVPGGSAPPVRSLHRALHKWWNPPGRLCPRGSHQGFRRLPSWVQLRPGLAGVPAGATGGLCVPCSRWAVSGLTRLCRCSRGKHLLPQQSALVWVSRPERVHPDWPCGSQLWPGVVQTCLVLPKCRQPASFLWQSLCHLFFIHQGPGPIPIKNRRK